MSQQNKNESQQPNKDSQKEDKPAPTQDQKNKITEANRELTDKAQSQNHSEEVGKTLEQDKPIPDAAGDKKTQ